MTEKKVIISGSIDKSVSDALKTQFLAFNDQFRIDGESNFNTINFNIQDFRQLCSKGFHYIFCLESLNPRPVTLNKDIDILSSVLPKDVLKERLIILFFQNDNYQKSLDEIREKCIENFKVMFEAIGLIGSEEKEKFAENQIWLFDSSSLQSNCFENLANNNIELYVLEITSDLDEKLNQDQNIQAKNENCRKKKIKRGNSSDSDGRSSFSDSLKNLPLTNEDSSSSSSLENYSFTMSFRIINKKIDSELGQSLIKILQKCIQEKSD